MGGCFSSSLLSESELPPPTVKVVSINGELREYNLPISVSQVLQAETEAVSSPSSSSSSSNAWFLCNSDLLSYDDYIPALNPQLLLLQPNQLYFVLPKSKLQYKLSASDMAALAVKASVAIQKASVNSSAHRRKKTRISPLVLLNENEHTISDRDVNIKSYEAQGFRPKSKQLDPRQISRSGSVRKMQRYSSKRAKLAVRSFRLRLSTIYEGTVL